MQDHRNAVARIKSLLDSLPGGERAVAAFILQNVEKIPHLSIQRLARESGVSTASVSRLARKLGYANFREVKINLARAGSESLSSFFEEVSLQDSDDELVRKMFAANVRSLERTLGQLEIDQLTLLSRSILRARTVVFFGTGSSGHIAQDAALRFCHIGVAAEACTEPVLALARAAMLGRSDVAIATSHSGRSAVPVKCIQIARSRGARAACITNYPESPLAQTSDQVLCTSFCETAVRSASVSSRIAQVSLIDALYLLTARQLEDLGEAHFLNELVEETIRIPVEDSMGEGALDRTDQVSEDGQR